ncbi:MAG TPA: four helix bundle protein [candidate division WOR-3 bacterium]|uniref:Four helix bundle protein n=1 Tax=candidate division WOR-3 bacterium TaxID=2052148 RepID=A0A9C9K0I4_UNCW3|nr:four helix bundle protein [candidate division WOR-3 bacterium]
MDAEELKKRTKKFALNVIKLVEKFPKTKTGDIIGRQLLKSATSVGANYRSACRAQSHAHFISKISIVEEESDESLYWLELTLESNLAERKIVLDLINEANELTAIFSSSRQTARSRRWNAKIGKK